MKTLTMLAAFVAGSVLTVRADTAPAASIPTPPPTAYRVIGQGANHRVWQRETFEKAPDGRVVTRIHKYTELAAGMNYQDAQGQWVESKETIETFADGAIARQGQYQVIFANNLNSSGAIDLQTPDGKRLRSNILGLAYIDGSTGQGVMIAEVRDTQGELVGNNQVIYQDAFDGVKADVQYTYNKGGFEQDIILREQPPTPESFGFNPATTRLEVFTEFVNPPPETISLNMDDTGTSQDQDISWGVTHIGHGKAFDLSEENDATGVAVEKRYITVAGRKFLIEMVPVRAVADTLSQLPDQASINKLRPMLAKSEAAMIPAARRKNSEPKPMKLAAVTPASKGYVLDYITINVSQTNFIFQGDNTYSVSGNINLAGVTTIEGGTVIKLDTNNACSINVLGSVVCKTAPYCPAVFTSTDDSTVGESVGGGGGSVKIHIINVEDTVLNP